MHAGEPQRHSWPAICISLRYPSGLSCWTHFLVFSSLVLSCALIELDTLFYPSFLSSLPHRHPRALTPRKTLAMRLSFTQVISGLLLPVIAAAATTPTATTPTTAELLAKAKAGVDFTGKSEYKPEAYAQLAALRKLFNVKLGAPDGYAVNTAAASKNKPALFKGGSRRLTNAQRLRMGLAPNPPTRRAPGYRRQEPSPVPPVTDLGIALGTDSEGNSLGYISATYAASGQLSTTSDSSSTVQFSVTYPSGSTSPAGLRVEMTNAPVAGAPLLALISGRDNVDDTMSLGSWHYLYIGGAEPAGTVPGSTPAAGFTSVSSITGLSPTFETDVWTLNPTTGTLTAIWTNPDGSTIPVGLYLQNGVLYALADPVAFNAQYPDPLTPFIWNIVPSAPVNRK